MNKDFHISQAHEHLGVHPNLPFWISMIKESQKLLTPNTQKAVLDFGSGSGKFLPLFRLMDSLRSGIGIEMDEGLVKASKENYEDEQINFFNEEKLIDYQNQFDVAYSQEVLYTITDLSDHAKKIYNCLKEGGYYFSTMGCHIENPLWAHRRAIIKAEEEYPVNDYSIEEISEVFYQTGFEVGLKRLPVDYFIIYGSETTKHFSKSYLDLVNTSYDNKMLFLFWKRNKK
ncbi:MAG: class I SAM-dependent methyltransferase [Sediminibacterium sp.]|nr:MAG: class I SAM-dependent methyltransferase [Sediminibacterium sp.]